MTLINPLDGVDALVTMDISREDSAYDALCNVAALVQVLMFLVALSSLALNRSVKNLRNHWEEN